MTFLSDVLSSENTAINKSIKVLSFYIPEQANEFVFNLY